MQKARYKKQKMRCLPGDVWKGVKAKMLEGKWPEESRAKSFKKTHTKKVNRRFRQGNKIREMGD